MRKTWLLTGVIVVIFAGSAVAQTGAAHPGYYPIEEMGIFAKGDLEVDVDVSGAMLQVAAGAMENQDESLADLVSSLERVRVQVGTPSGADAAAIGGSIADAKAKLGSAGWDKILSVEEGDEQVYLYAREADGNIVGLTVFVNEAGEEVVVVNIVGDIDPKTLGRLLANFNDFDLEELMSAVEQ
jgi:hypothetical protein